MLRSRVVPALLVAVASALAILAGAGALGAATCSFASGELEVVPGARERVTIMREGAMVGVRTSAAEPCAMVDLAQLETLSVTGTPGRDVVVVDLLGGPLEGGAEHEAGVAETELLVDLGSGRLDRLVVRAPAGGGTIVLGEAGIALNADGDADVFLAGVEHIVFDGRQGPDVLSGAGGSGTGGPATVPVVLSGGAGEDALVGGRGPDTLLGGAGRDELSAGDGDDVLVGGADQDRMAGGRGGDRFAQGEDPDGSDVMFGHGGRDIVDYGARSGPVTVTIGDGADDGAVGSSESDRVASDIEVVVGGLADDVLRAPPRSRAPYELFGGPGADILFGGEGDDVLSGGRGTDTVSYTGSPVPVRVDLRRGRALGTGRDRLLGIEDVVGSRFGDLLRGNRLDNVLDGWRGPDDIRGGAGADELFGGIGDDMLSGDAGRDVLAGERGNDLLLGGPGRDTLEGGPGSDSLIGGPDRDVLSGGLSTDSCADLGEPRRSCELLL